jgi:histidinol-phosphatase (PHP family)
MKKNYHTHTYRCKHATGEVADYCRAAVAQGIALLGFSDHAPLPDNRWIEVRMSMEELLYYLRDIDWARRSFPRLGLLKGLECEYDDSYRNYFHDVLLGEYRLDYLVGGQHWFLHEGRWTGLHGRRISPAELGSYAAHLVRSIQSGLFAFIAHPDAFGMAYPEWDAQARACARDILSAAAACRVPLEINGYGLRKRMIETSHGPRNMYPWRPFWELATEYNITVLPSSDAHNPEDVSANLDDTEQIAREYGLTVADMAALDAKAGLPGTHPRGTP